MKITKIVLESKKTHTKIQLEGMFGVVYITLILVYPLIVVYITLMLVYPLIMDYLMWI